MSLHRRRADQMSRSTLMPPKPLAFVAAGLTLMGVLSVARPAEAAPLPVSVDVTPMSSVLNAGEYDDFVATETFDDASTLDVTSTATWSSDAPTVASIDATGHLISHMAGSATIKAVIDGFEDTAAITVNPAIVKTLQITPSPAADVPLGLTEQLTATGHFSDGTDADVSSSSTWMTDNPAVATVDSSGLVTSVGLGTTTIHAARDEGSDAVSITVIDAELTSIDVTPASNMLSLGDAAHYTATGHYTDLTTLDISSSVTWESSLPSIATIDSTGFLNAVGVGSTTIKATLGAVEGSTDLTVGPALPISIISSPNPLVVAAGLTQQIDTTEVYTDSSSVLVPAADSYVSNDTAVATVDANGLVTGVAIGTTTIDVTYSGFSDSVSVTVTAPVLGSIEISPTMPHLAKGLTLQLTAIGHYSDSSTADLTSQVSWHSESPATVTIDSNGLMSAVDQGITGIDATLGAVVGEDIATVTAPELDHIFVSPNPLNVPVGLSVGTVTTTVLTDNTTGIVTADLYDSLDPGVATVDPFGFVTGVAEGAAAVAVTYAGKTDLVLVFVGPAVPIAEFITSSITHTPLGIDAQLTSKTTLSDSSDYDSTGSATWESSDPGVATVVGGLVHPLSVGTTTITVTDGTASADLLFTVDPAILQSIAVTPDNGSIGVGFPQQFTATGTYSDSHTEDLTGSATWASSAPAKVSIDPSGLGHALTQGPSTISATVGLISGSTTFTVTAPVVVSVSVTPSNPTLGVGIVQQMTGTALMSDGSFQTVQSPASWLSSNPAVASIDALGRLTANSVGTTTVTVTASGILGTATVTIVAPVVMSVSVSPSSATIAKGQTKQFTATATLSDGSVVPVQTPAAFFSSNPTVASIDTNGLATSVGVGTTTITVSASGILGSATLNVGPAQATSVLVTPSSPTVVKGLTQQYTAVATYTDGSTLDVTSTAVWATGTPGVATINTSGKATAVNVGTSTVTATVGSATGGAGITVVAPTLVPGSLVITPNTATVPVATTQQLNLTGQYTDGSTQNLTAAAVWSSGTPAAATVSATGLVTGVAVGGSTISATLGSNPAVTAAISVTKGAVSLSTPGAVRKVNGVSATVTYSSQLRDAAGAGIAGRTIVFEAAGSTACSATTNASGVGICSHAYSLLLSAPAPSAGSSYTVTFGGDANHLNGAGVGTVIAG